MLAALCARPLIEKTRFLVCYEGLLWHVDEFKGDNAGLVLAEIELEHPDQPVPLPPWVGQEVTHDPRYRTRGWWMRLGDGSISPTRRLPWTILL
jgi:adenylate cyclase